MKKEAAPWVIDLAQQLANTESVHDKDNLHFSMQSCKDDECEIIDEFTVTNFIAESDKAITVEL